MSIGPAVFDLHGLAIGVSECLKPSKKSCQMWLGILGRSAAEKADHGCRLLLGPRYNRPRYSACDEPQKFAPLHRPPSNDIGASLSPKSRILVHRPDDLPMSA